MGCASGGLDCGMMEEQGVELESGNDDRNENEEMIIYLSFNL